MIKSERVQARRVPHMTWWDLTSPHVLILLTQGEQGSGLQSRHCVDNFPS